MTTSLMMAAAIAAQTVGAGAPPRVAGPVPCVVGQDGGVAARTVLLGEPRSCKRTVMMDGSSFGCGLPPAGEYVVGTNYGPALGVMMPVEAANGAYKVDFPEQIQRPEVVTTVVFGTCAQPSS